MAKNDIRLPAAATFKLPSRKRPGVAANTHPLYPLFLEGNQKQRLKFLNIKL